MKTLPLRTLQTGSEDPPAEYRELSSGPLSLRYENAGLRNIRFGTREAVRRVGLAVRDRNWNAVPFRVGGLQHERGPGGFSVSFLAASARGGGGDAPAPADTGSDAPEAGDAITANDSGGSFNSHLTFPRFEDPGNAWRTRCTGRSCG